MKEEEKKRNKIIGIGLGILIVLLVVVTSTYAYWQVYIKQDDANSIVSQCLSLTMENQTGTFGLADAAPISDTEGLTKEGFTFDVVNHCDKEVSYIIGMDSIVIDYTSQNKDGYLQDGSIKISLDSSKPIKYGELKEIIHEEENDTYEIRNSKEINTATVAPYGTNTHNIKAWIDYDAPLSENNRVFGGRVFITGGHGIEDDNPIGEASPAECFEMSGNEIVGYNESCGKNVTIPAKIDGVEVKTIDTNAFKESSIEVKYYDYYMSPINTPFDKSKIIAAGVVENYNEGDQLNFENLINLFGYGVIYTDDETVDTAMHQLLNGGQDLYYDTPTNKDFEGFKDKDLVVYIESLDLDMVGIEYYYKGSKANVSITGLDLSLASHLEKIEPRAFTNIETPTTSDEEEYGNFKTSLTSLTFGSNSNSIEIGYGAFAGVDLDELTVYTSYYPKLLGDSLKTAVYSNDWATMKSENYIIGYFSFSDIDKLTVKPTANEKVVKAYDDLAMQLYGDVRTSNLVISNGITNIERESFGVKRAVEVGTSIISLPNTLLTIGDSSFAGLKFTAITIPSSVTYVGSNAFAGNIGSNGIITVDNSASATSSWHENWSNTATVQYTK